jgi:hypothetical protein
MENKNALFRPVTITFETLDRLCKEDKSADLIALYMSYVAITQWQNTTSIKATTDFMATRLKWDRHKLIATKKKLEQLGLIEARTTKDKLGKVTRHYIRVMYVITSETQSGQNPQGGETHSVEMAHTSTINEQQSASNLQKSAGIHPKEKATEARLRILNGRIKDGYSADDILGAAKAFSHSTWHRENKQMSIDNLIAPSKFGRWFAQKDEPNRSGPIKKEDRAISPEEMDKIAEQEQADFDARQAKMSKAFENLETSDGA